MNKINIGFIGGCIHKQIGMQRADLYHSVLASTLSKNEFLDYSISLATYFTFDKLAEQTQQFIEKNSLHIVFVFIRPFPLMPLQKLLIKYDRPEKKTGWAVHPALFYANKAWPAKFGAHQSDNGYMYLRRRRFELRDINILAGISLGLHGWAMTYLQTQLSRIKSLCEKENVKLCIISPPRNPESMLGDVICKWTSRSLADFCVHNNISLININPLNIDYFEKDKLHFNIKGHKMIAEMIYDELMQN